jgi:hypothetical protein
MNARPTSAENPTPAGSAERRMRARIVLLACLAVALLIVLAILTDNPKIAEMLLIGSAGFLGGAGLNEAWRSSSERVA